MLSSANSLYISFTGVLHALSHTSKQSSAASMWTALLLLVKKNKKITPELSVCLTDLLQQFILNEFKLHTDGHFGDELVTSFLGHLFAVSQVDMANASTALEIGQRLVCDPVTDCREKLGWEKN